MEIVLTPSTRGPSTPHDEAVFDALFPGHCSLGTSLA